jgi:hypothetical protein
MSKKGFVYIDTSSASPGAPPEERFGQYLGVTNLTSAMQNGYHPSAQAKSEIDLRKSHLQSQIDNPPSPQYLAALSGPANSPGTGCIGQTSQTLGDAHGVDPTNLLGQLSDQATTSVLESGQYKTALAAWSRCMEQQGIHPPASPFDLIPQYGKTPSPTAEEIKVATADVNCKSSSGLVATFMAQERQVQARLADQNAVAIGEVRGAEQQMLDRAKQVLAAGN